MSSSTTMDKERVALWLRDAHAMEEHAETMLSGQASRLTNYPPLRQRIERHLEETRAQAVRIERCLEGLDSGGSITKDLAAKFGATMQSVGGMFVGDEVVKGAMAGYVFEHFEIASYTALIAAAEEAGEPEVVRVCRQNLAEEQAMAEWLLGHLPAVTETFLRREMTGGPAKR